MAALNAMWTVLVRIGYTNAAAQVIVEEQGMDVLEEIQLLTDNEIENLCKVIRQPGGVIPGTEPRQSSSKQPWNPDKPTCRKSP